MPPDEQQPQPDSRLNQRVGLQFFLLWSLGTALVGAVVIKVMALRVARSVMQMEYHLIIHIAWLALAAWHAFLLFRDRTRQYLWVLSWMIALYFGMGLPAQRHSRIIMLIALSAAQVFALARERHRPWLWPIAALTGLIVYESWSVVAPEATKYAAKVPGFSLIFGPADYLAAHTYGPFITTLFICGVVVAWWMPPVALPRNNSN